MRHERPSGTPRQAVISVNRQLLAAFLFGLVAWLCWPASATQWPLVLIAAITALAAVNSTITAFTLMVRIYRRDRRIAAMLAKGRVAHPAEMVDREALRRAGMSDD